VPAEAPRCRRGAIEIVEAGASTARLNLGGCIQLFDDSVLTWRAAVPGGSGMLPGGCLNGDQHFEATFDAREQHLSCEHELLQLCTC
jgi:hypothetical protein